MFNNGLPLVVPVASPCLKPSTMGMEYNGRVASMEKLSSLSWVCTRLRGQTTQCTVHHLIMYRIARFVFLIFFTTVGLAMLQKQALSIATRRNELLERRAGADDGYREVQIGPIPTHLKASWAFHCR